MNKLSRLEVIVFISVLPIMFMIFVEHDEFLMLFLIEIAFIVIIGLLYTIPVVIMVYLSEWIKKKLNKNKEE